jgi:hypothetical protein
MHGNRARARQLVPTEHTISASARPASIDKGAEALSILSASGIGCCLMRIWEQRAPVGCSSDGSGNRHGEDHDEISTDRPGGSVLAGRSYVCHGSKWPSHWRISTSAVEPQSFWLLWIQGLLRSTSLCAWDALLRSGLSRPTLRPLQTLARLAVASP